MRPQWFQDRCGIFFRQTLHIPDTVRSLVSMERDACSSRGLSQMTLYSHLPPGSEPTETMGMAWSRAIRKSHEGGAAASLSGVVSHIGQMGLVSDGGVSCRRWKSEREASRNSLQRSCSRSSSLGPR
jgi:hypothetical protein